MAPETLECLRPLLKRPHRVGVGAIEDLASLSPDVHQADVAEHLEVLRDGRLTQMKRGDDVADGAFVDREIDEDVAPTGFCDRIKDVRGRGGARHGLELYSYYGICQSNASSLGNCAVHSTSSGVSTPSFFTPSRIGLGAPARGMVTSTQSSSPGARRDGSAMCSGMK